MNPFMKKIKEVRAELHRNPEHSGHEEKTKQIIREFLKNNTDLYFRDHKGGIALLFIRKIMNIRMICWNIR